jgi:hypothetical protein
LQRRHDGIQAHSVDALQLERDVPFKDIRDGLASIALKLLERAGHVAIDPKRGYHPGA